MPEDYLQPFNAFCPDCEKTVTAHPLFTRTQARKALRTGAQLAVMHPAGRDHLWRLGKQDRDNLRRAMSAGAV